MDDKTGPPIVLVQGMRKNYELSCKTLCYEYGQFLSDFSAQ
jgi:hypothetical protein